MCRRTFTSAYLCVCQSRGQVSVVLTPLFGERDSSMELLQLSPEAVQTLQDVLHTGLEVLLHADECAQHIHPIREERTVLIQLSQVFQREGSTLISYQTSPFLQVGLDQLHFVCQFRVIIHLECIFRCNIRLLKYMRHRLWT